ncbi:hypothetical protein ADK60_30785 [Streptomyces sp. XY431]|uniref:hypothetical protein n=1 Tax=Streptomyces sp. XY431 TaxID=1415562 RepID=UPI0006B051DB|nr:hypothetical protein [Streptomyces sp. XY431]KOV13100.1 hypothetical protein ADK60_30785 [Streptomyces sp. XY431]
MSTEGAPLELAHYYPGWIWDDASVGRMKSLLLYFDGFALLLPEHHFETTVAREARLAGPLYAAGLLHNLEPDSWLDADSALLVQEAAQETRQNAVHEPPHSVRSPRAGEFGGSITGGHFGPVEVRAPRIDELLQTGAVTRRRPDLGPDMVEMPPEARGAALMALALVAQRRVLDRRLHLVGDLPASDGAAAFTLHRDLEDVGVDLSSVPLDEILDFRREHGDDYKTYARELRAFVRELEGTSHPAERERLLLDRSESLADRASALRRARRGWGRPLASLALAGAGAAWTLHQADPVGALVAISGAAAGFARPAKQPTPFTYLLEARRLG